MIWHRYDGDGKHQDWHPPTADGVARALAERHADRLRYCHDARAWFVWNGTIWRRDRTGHVVHLVRDVARALGTDPGARTTRTTGARAFVAAAELFARSEPDLAVTASVWGADPMLLGTPDGVVDLRARPREAHRDEAIQRRHDDPCVSSPGPRDDSGDLAPADPALGITRTTAVAPSDAADCPLWRTFLSETFAGDDALIGFVQKFCGYALTGSTRAQVTVIGFGRGRNGKSVFLNTILGVMGDYARPGALGALLSTDRSRHGALQASYRGARLVGVAESDGLSTERPTERQFKLLTGGDLLPCDDGEAPGRASCKLLVMCNVSPALPRYDGAIGRRLCVVPFRYSPAKADHDLERKLRAEWPGILRWAIDGCRRWQAEGLVRPAAVNDATLDMMLDQDPIGQFILERCGGGAADGTGSETAAALYAAWRRWAEAAGEPAGTQRAFAAALADRGFARDRAHHGRLYRGLTLEAGVTQ